MSFSSPLSVPTRLRPVTLKCSRVDIELHAQAREKLLRRVRHLAGAATLVPKLDVVSGPVELSAAEKGFLVVAITAWVDNEGRNRVPGELLRLHTTLLGDLYYPVEAVAEPEAASAAPVAVEATAEAAPPEVEPRVDRARLSAIHAALEEQLEELAEVDDGSLGRARAALRRAVTELCSALDG
jgi:hypothetical protein